jgi:pyroglutamyl-peptidase
MASVTDFPPGSFTTMTSVLITAFEPYGDWLENSSWLTVVELTRELPENPRVTTRRYPVDVAVVRERLAEDLAANHDFALHLGQAPGSGQIRLEALGINVVEHRRSASDGCRVLAEDGPVAYRCPLPLAEWSQKLRQAGIPSGVSYHAGTYLCNAVFYLSQHLAHQQGLKTRSALLHLPLEIAQTLPLDREYAAWPRAMLAAATRLILEEMATVRC